MPRFSRGQNTSHAVMSQRTEDKDSLDFFPTPPWGTRALIDYLPNYLVDPSYTVWEPACGRGDMAEPLAEHFGRVLASDIEQRGFGQKIDFLWPSLPKRLEQYDAEIDWVITNPPFKLADQFALKALEIAQVGVAMLCRASFMEGVKRHAGLYQPYKPRYFCPFVERLPIIKNRLDPDASSATAYAWFVWDKIAGGAGEPWEVLPLGPCRRRLERPGDYDRYKDEIEVAKGSLL